MSKIKLSDWKNIAEIVGIAVVVISLVCVGLQVRQSTLAVQSAAAPTINNNFAGWYSSVQSDPTLTVISVTGMSELSEVGEAYVLQMGAFRERVLAAKAANEIRMQELKIIATRRGEQDWYVLVLDTYESYVDAREAGEAYLDAYPKGSIWVRTTADLKSAIGS